MLVSCYIEKHIGTYMHSSCSLYELPNNDIEFYFHTDGSVSIRYSNCYIFFIFKVEEQVATTKLWSVLLTISIECIIAC